MISVIIPTYNNSMLLKRAIRSIMDQNFPVNNYELIIVDNASIDDTATVVERIIKEYNTSNLFYEYEKTPGLLSGRHRGLNVAKGDLLVFADEDIHASPDWLSEIFSTFQNIEVQLVTGKNLPEYESEPPEWVKKMWIKNEFGITCGELSLLDFGDKELEIPTEFVWGLNFAIRKEALIELGGFNPDAMPPDLQQFQGDGETGLSYKAAKKGYKAKYNPNAKVFHFVPNSRMTPKYFKKRYFYQGVADSYTEIRGKLKINKKNSFMLLSMMVKKNISIMLRLFKILVMNISKLTQTNIRFRILFLYSYLLGYNYHNKKARSSAQVFNWIQKKDYWEYSFLDNKK